MVTEEVLVTTYVPDPDKIKVRWRAHGTVCNCICEWFGRHTVRLACASGLVP